MAEVTQRKGGSRQTRLAVEGMTCGNCARHVTEALQSVSGVDSAMVNLEAHQATVRWKSGAATDDSDLLKALEEAGYQGKPQGAEVQETATRMGGWALNVWLGAPVTMLLMVGEWAFGLGMTPWFRWFSFFAAAVVQIFAGARFYRGAWKQLKTGSSNMDTLVALGSTTAFGYSTWALLSGRPDHIYFMEAAAIITLISVGHWLESRMSVKASGALRKLLDLAPAMARRRTAAGEQEVPASELAEGDEVVLRPGDRIPTDGIVVDGFSAVDEAMLTGESVPVEKAQGSQLYAGTVNLNGRLIARVNATGDETALAHIIAAVQRAQTSRAGIQRLGDKVSSVFVPIVVAIAIAAGLWWGLAPESARSAHEWLAQFLWHGTVPVGIAAAFIIAAAVLIIACPCAMGLATPAAIMAGSNAAAQRGILIRDGVALEKAGTITAVLFDKTGTLTEGKAAVAATWEASGTTGTTGLAALLASQSRHPLSEAIAKSSRGAAHPLEMFEEVRGSGILARLTGVSEPIMLGSRTWLEESQVDLSPGEAFYREWSSQGATVVGLARGRQLLALFSVRDALKTGAAAVIQRLHDQGLKTYMVTGDHQLTAEGIARQAGIRLENVFAGVRPEKKSDLVRQLQSKGERIAFVGDGINDAPALEQADLGVAVSRASDIAREAADIILLKSDIEAVGESLGLARATLRTIKQNLFWAFFYNGIGVPLAALGFMSPILCAAAMGFSDVIVLGNALRLRSWKLKS